jgi:predicted NBD/HSP70 family sugar kinase
VCPPHQPTLDPNGRHCGCGARGCLETSAGAGAARNAAADALADALRSVVHVLDPEAIVLGGRFAGWGDLFAKAVEQRLRARTLGATWHPCRVVPSRFGGDAALVGAAAAALSRVLDDPTVVPRADAVGRRPADQGRNERARRRSRTPVSPGRGAPA